MKYATFTPPSKHKMVVTGEAESLVLGYSSSPSSSSYFCCRICHEYESLEPLESPCTCSGTAKFAHRDCIQRWCHQKGNTTCEICLQNYEPGYTARPIPKKLRLIEEEEDEPWGAMIRDSSQRSAVPGFPVETEEEEEGNSDCTVAADRAASCCRSFALTFTVFLLLRHAIDVLARRPEHYPFPLLTVLVLRMSGIIIPMFVVFRTIMSVQDRIRRHYRVVDVEEEESDRRLQHIV
ncbi:hypothetical protein MLD38_028159 [Melastoma candidum]|uniref:Uncharacterized protein n=1 Tax=Melastoma candidum TaxID=119954 RepID=A0ACB9N014_9MYRT|nr:hypothetical protein MLD38_028159 [Melastoma candidum]